MIVSPIFYMGNKKKLIKKGLVDLFPENIDNMVELFGGSAIVSMNTRAKVYYISDINPHLVDLYKLFKYSSSDKIIEHIWNRINEFKLPKERTKRNMFIGREDIIEGYKKSYISFRNFYNKNKNVLDFYTLMFFSFSQQFRFNSKGDFNMPYGSDCFSTQNEEYIKNGCSFFGRENVNVGKGDFRNLNIDLLGGNDFVYLDPPYLNTTATYNEQNGWTIQDEQDLYNLCEALNEKGIKFGMSNVFENKGHKNVNLIHWCEKHGFNVYTFDKFSYYACGKGNSNSKEVFITNYKAI